MKYCRNPEIRTTLMPDGHVVLFNPKTEWAQILNPLGSLVWEFCDGTNSLSEIKEQIASLVAVPGELDLQNEIKFLVEELASNGLLNQN